VRILIATLLIFGFQAWPVSGFSAQVNIMARAEKHLPALSELTDRHWPDAPRREVIAAQVEQESRWNPKAELKTSREYGFGLAQITVTSRFDNFREARRLSALKDWQWEDRHNARYQMTYLVLTDRSNFRQVSRLFQDDTNRWAAALVAYNAGMGTLLQRRALALRTNSVTPTKWFGGLDAVRLPYENRLLYGRNLGAMRNEYPHLIIKVRAPKYRGML
jgi:membrane-bound lytic murein transglycosylase MltF